MNTKQLYYALSNQRLTKKLFDGVYARDTLEDIQSKPSLIICNTDRSSKKGKHWVLFYFEGDVCEFYDSLGHNLTFYGKEFETFVSRFAVKYRFTRNRTQPKNTKLCGVYCLFFAFWRCQGISMRRIIRGMRRGSNICKLVEVAFRICLHYPCPLLQNVLAY